MKTIMAVVRGVERVSANIVAVIITAIMLIVVADVFLRYVVHSPIFWAYDVVSLYLMVGAFYLTVSEAYVRGAHVSVDILRPLMSPAVLRASELLSLVIGLAVFVLITATAISEFKSAYEDQDVVAGVIPWPKWPVHALAIVGAGLMVVRLAITILARLFNYQGGEADIQASHHEGTRGVE